MTRSLFPGTTEYASQSLDDILPDLIAWEDELEKTNAELMSIVKELEESEYWKTVYVGFRDIIAYAIKFYGTSKNEISDIIGELSIEVQSHHVSRLKTIGLTAQKLNSEFGSVWKRDYPEQNMDYDNSSFLQVDRLYGKGRDMAAGLLDIINVADRLNDFVGKKTQGETTSAQLNKIFELKPNICGFGININAIIERFRGKK